MEALEDALPGLQRGSQGIGVVAGQDELAVCAVRRAGDDRVDAGRNEGWMRDRCGIVMLWRGGECGRCVCGWTTICSSKESSAPGVPGIACRRPFCL